MQYAWRSKKYSEYDWDNGWKTLAYRPLFEDVYIRPGATYWCEKYISAQLSGETKSKNYSYLDINYFTLDFSLGEGEPLDCEKDGVDDTSSACFIRCVEDVE